MELDQSRLSNPTPTSELADTCFQHKTMQKRKIPISFKPSPYLIVHTMPLKLAIILLLLLPFCVTCAVLKLAGFPWPTTVAVAAVPLAFVTAVLLVFVAAVRLFDLLRRLRPSRWQQQPAAESTGAPPQEAAVLGLGASAIANLPVYKYKKSGGGGDECSVCLGEVKLKETVKQLPVCAHLFHEGCIDVWLRSHGTCPVCRTPVNAAAAPAPAPASVEIVVHTDQAN